MNCDRAWQMGEKVVKIRLCLSFICPELWGGGHLEEKRTGTGHPKPRLSDTQWYTNISRSAPYFWLRQFHGSASFEGCCQAETHIYLSGPGLITPCGLGPPRSTTPRFSIRIISKWLSKYWPNSKIRCGLGRVKTHWTQAKSLRGPCFSFRSAGWNASLGDHGWGWWGGTRVQSPIICT